MRAPGPARNSSARLPSESRLQTKDISDITPAAPLPGFPPHNSDIVSIQTCVPYPLLRRQWKKVTQHLPAVVTINPVRTSAVPAKAPPSQSGETACADAHRSCPDREI